MRDGYKSGIPVAKRLPTLPPRVSGPTRFFLKLKVFKILWNSTANAKKNASLPIVKIQWWGDEGSGDILSPLNVGWTKTSPSKKSKTTITYAVQCYRKQLNAYFVDSSGLVLNVLLDGVVIGNVSVKDLSSLVKESPRPVNGFFPVNAVASSEISRGSLNALGNTSKILGEMHVVLEIEEVPVGKSSSPGKESSTQTTKRPISSAKSSPKKSKPSSPRKSISKQENQISAAFEEHIPRPPPEHVEPQPTLIESAFTEDPFRSPNASRIVLPDVLPGNSSQECSKLDMDIASSKIPLPIQRPVSLNLLNDIFQKAEKLQSSIDSSLKASQALNHGKLQPKNLDVNATANNDIPDKDDYETLTNFLANETISDDDELFLMDDEVIIHALNENARMEDKDYSELEGKDPVDLEIDELSDDGVKARVLNLLNAKVNPVIKNHTGPSGSLSIDKLTCLGRVHSVHVSIASFSPTTMVAALEYTLTITIPQLPDGKSFQMDTKAKFKKHRFQVTHDSSEIKVPVDLSDACSIFFDSALIESWMNQYILIKVSAEYPHVPAKTKSGKNKAEWTGNGKIECRDLLQSEDLKISGKIPIWNIAGAAESRLLGSLEMTVELVKDVVAPPLVEQNQRDLPTHAIPLPAIPREHPLVYLYLRLSTLRAQSLSHLSRSGTVMVYLSVRFSHLHQPLDTPPILLSPTFDPATGLLNAPTDFKADFTLPLPVSANVEFSESALIVEVWSILGISLVEESHDKGPELLGLARLPFSYLMSMRSDNQSELPILLPQTEYAVADPFSGKSSGWLAASLAIGSLEQVSKLCQSHQQNVTSSKMVEVDPRSQLETRAESPTRSRSDMVSAIKDKPRHVSKVTRELETSSSENPTPVVLSISLHRACGLKGLLEHAIRMDQINQSKRPQLEFALDSGVNSRIRLTLFPDQTDSNYEDDDSTVESESIMRSFCPIFVHRVELTLAELDSNLLRWIQNGGVAKGQILHRIPKDVAGDAIFGEDIILGEFQVPLARLLTRTSGIHQEWVQLIPPNSDTDMPVLAAILVSIKFIEGYDLGELLDSKSGFGGRWMYKGHLSIENVVFPDVLSNRGIFAEWSIPTWISNKLEYSNFETETLWNFKKGDSGQIALFNGSIDFPIDVDSHVLESLQTTKLAINFYQVDTDGKATFAGSVNVDLYHLLQEAKKGNRGRQADTVREHGSFYLVDPDSPCLSGVKVALSLAVSRSRAGYGQNKIQVHPKSTDCLKTSDLVKRDLQSTKIETFKLYVKVDRAMQLPMLKDLSIKESPFVKPNELQLAPPSSFVTFDWEDALNLSVKTQKTPIIFNQSCPSWNQDFILEIPKQDSHLQTLRKTGKIVFKVWTLCNHLGKSQTHDDEASELLGEAIVELSTLFFGMDKIHGWYPIQSPGGNCKGQIMVQVYSSEPLRGALSPNPSLHPRPLEKKSQGQATSMTRQSPVSPIGMSASQNVETWIWAGDKWEHRQVESKSLSEKLGFGSATPIEKNRTSLFYKTMTDLDNLQTKIKTWAISPRSPNPLEAGFPKSKSARLSTDASNYPLPVERIDHVLRNARGWSPELPLEDGSKAEPLTLDELVSGPAITKEESTQYDPNANATTTLEEKLSETGALALSASSSQKSQADDEIVVYKSTSRSNSKVYQTQSSPVSMTIKEDEDGAIFEELARRRVAASKKAYAPVIEDAKAILQEARESSHSAAPFIHRKWKDDRLL